MKGDGLQTPRVSALSFKKKYIYLFEGQREREIENGAAGIGSGAHTVL